jgi:hypothetical protein
MRSCRRISAGNTIWRFDETVVFMLCKRASYATGIKKGPFHSKASRWFADRSVPTGLRAHARRSHAVALGRSMRARGCQEF